MAAPFLREAFDCVVLGSGTTAGSLASSLANRGFSTLLVRNAVRGAGCRWLQPRLAREDDGVLLRRQSVGGVTALNAAGQRLTMMQAAAARNPLESAPPGTLPAVLYLSGEDTVTCEEPGACRLGDASGSRTIRAQIVFEVSRPAVVAPRPAVGGIYRNVLRAPSEERQALLFATQSAGDVFWLVPLADRMTSLGLLYGGSTTHTSDEAAQLLEDALVACPALTQRLIAAHLVGGLHRASPGREANSANSTGMVALPEYDHWFDPVFNSGVWLAEELATQVVTVLQAGNTRSGCHDRLHRWLETWPAVEQLARERIAPWYRLDASLPEALHDHAQRAWYQRLLTAECHSTSFAPALQWEARSPLPASRRELTL